MLWRRSLVLWTEVFLTPDRLQLNLEKRNRLAVFTELVCAVQASAVKYSPIGRLQDTAWSTSMDEYIL